MSYGHFARMYLYAAGGNIYLPLEASGSHEKLNASGTFDFRHLLSALFIGEVRKLLSVGLVKSYVEETQTSPTIGGA